MRLLAIGDNVVDFYQDQGIIYPGGNALNVAVLAKRYGLTHSSYMGILGSDTSAAHVKHVLEQEQIDTTRIRQAFGPNGEAVVSLNEEGDRIFVRSNKGGVQALLGINLNSDDESYIASHDLLHTSVYSRLEHHLPELSQKIPVSFDFSTRRDSAYLEQVCPYLTYAFFSGSDLSKEQCFELSETALEYGTKVIGITRGSQGALFFDQERAYEQSVIQTEVIDTLGAGDSFIAMFLTQYHQHQRMEEALQRAAEAAAETCKVYGAFGYGVPKEGSLF